MSATWKTIRVFISSTFRDMQAERDWLVRFVFPKLREELLKYRIHFVDVDLRWGVTGDQDALDVCREVIDQCHPRFMCMLGGRYGCVPAGREESITADEVHYGVLGREAEKRGHAFFYFRDDSATAQMEEETPGDFREPDGSDNATKLTALKKSVTDEGLPVFIYPAKWDVAHKRLTGLEVFGSQVHTDLLQSLKDDPELAARFTSRSTAALDEFTDEAEQMETFIEERTERYITGSRETLLRDMLAFAAAGSAPNIFVLTGDPGSGKSALLAKFTRDLASVRPSPFVIPHFIGASTGSTDLRRTLRRLCHELARAAGNTEPLPLDIKELITHFQKLLAEAAGKQRVILVFDALNQFDATDGAHWLNWLPRDLPPGVRIIASVIAPAKGEKEHQILAILRNRKDSHVEELKPLAEADTLEIIEGFLKRYSKKLDSKQVAALKEKPASNLPLYVLTALEELRTLGTYEEITDRIRTLPGDARELFGWILTERLARDPGFRDREGRPCGAALVEKFAACLGVSRHGLSPAELTALLDPGDPLGNVAALLRLLRPYLMRRGELLDFYHGQFREATVTAYLTSKSQRFSAHDQLATYFRDKADPENNQSWKGESPRPFFQVAFHLAGAQRLDELYALLLESPDWMNALYVVSASSVSYIDDLMLAMQTNPNLLTLLKIRAAKEAASSRIRHYHNDDLQILVRLGREQEAFAVAQSRSAPEDQCDSLIAIYEAKVKNQPDLGLLETALASANRIQHDYRRATMLDKIVSHVAETGAIQRATEIADQIGSALYRSRALKAIAVAMTRVGDQRASSTFIHALEVTKQIEDPSEGAANQASVMTEIAEELIRLKDDQATRVLEDALQIADRIATPWKRFWVHKAIATAWAHQGASDRVFEVALRIKNYLGNDDGGQLSCLAEIAQFLLKLQMFDMVSQIIGWIGDATAIPESRSSALLAIASAFAEVGNDQQASATFDQAVNATHQIPDALRRVGALVRVGLALHQAGDERAADALVQALAITDKLEDSEGNSARSEIAKALAQIGDFDIAMARARCIQDNHYRSEALQEIAKTLVTTGRLNQGLQLVQTHDEALASIASSLVLESKFDAALIFIDHIKRPQLQALPLAKIGLAMTKAQDRRCTSMFTRAIEALNRDEKPNEQAYELKEIAMLLLDGGDERASRIFDQSRRLATQMADGQEQSAALKQIVVALAQLGQFDRALAISRKVVNVATQAEALKEITISLAQARHFDNALSVAMEIKDGTIDDAIVSNSASRAEALCGAALALENAGQTKTALDVLERAILAAADIPRVFSWQQAFILEGIAIQFAQALQVERAYAATSQIQHESRVPRALAAVAVELADKGDKRNAQFLGQALKLAESMSDPGKRAESLRDVALVLAKAKNEQASQIFRRAVDSALQAKSENGQSYPMQLVGEALAQSGNFEWAVEIANQVERGWRRTPVLQALFKSLVLAGDQRATSLFEKLLVEARLVGTYNGARDGVLKNIIVDLIELNQRPLALEVVQEMSVDCASSYRIEAWNLIAKSFAQSGKFDEALSTLDLSSVSELHDRVSVLIRYLASWAPAFEKLQVGLTLEILSAITRIGGWTSPAWLRIHHILSRATSQ